MLFRWKQYGERGYQQTVENRREDGRVRQHVLLTLGPLDELTASGALDVLLSSGTRFSEQFLILFATAVNAEGHCTKSLTTQSGYVRKGCSFKKGAL